MYIESLISLYKIKASISQRIVPFKFVPILIAERKFLTSGAERCILNSDDETNGLVLEVIIMEKQKERRQPEMAYHRYVINGLKEIIKKVEETERLCDQLRVYPDRFDKFRLFGKK